MTLVHHTAGKLAALAVATVALTSSGASAQNKVKPARAAKVLENGSTEWPTFGHDPGGMRFSPLTQITPANVADLQVAWVYHMKQPGARAAAGGGRPGGPGGRPGPGGGPPNEAGGTPPPRRGADQTTAQAAAEGLRPGPGPGRGNTEFAISEVTPLVIHGIMYIGTPYGRVVALDPTSGKEMWTYDLPSGEPATRGVEYFPGDKVMSAQIVVGTSDAKLFLLDPQTGTLNKAFGTDGFVDLNTPEITHGLRGASDGLSSPPIMLQNMIIVGGRTTESGGPGPAGDVRAFDIHTGKLAWTFHSIPQPGEANYGTWGGDSAKERSGVNVWGLITVDAKRGIAYLPFGAPSGDAYGGDRPGNNLYGSSVVAVNAATGKYLWHFQAVHHDIWDFDLETPPLLMDVKRAGKSIPAVAIIGKNSLLFLLDRVTGKPIYGVEERAVAQSQVPQEKTSPTQPFPIKPEPIAKQSFQMSEIATVTPELEAACRKLIADNHLDTAGPFSPETYNHSRINFPSSIGGANWPGGSFNPKLGYFFINVSEMGQLQGHRDPANGPVSSTLAGTNLPAGRSGPFRPTLPGGRFKDVSTNMMCNQPPWGELVAVNVNTGNIAWRSTLGVTDKLPADKQKTGRPSIGGSIATAGGVVFIGGTDDARFRAFDAATGKELWSAKLDAVAGSVPSTYQGKDGRQYVVTVSSGSPFLESPALSDALTAYALPAK